MWAHGVEAKGEGQRRKEKGEKRKEKGEWEGFE
jgi:hypothetical protein